MTTFYSTFLSICSSTVFVFLKSRICVQWVITRTMGKHCLYPSFKCRPHINRYSSFYQGNNACGKS